LGLASLERRGTGGSVFWIAARFPDGRVMAFTAAITGGDCGPPTALSPTPPRARGTPGSTPVRMRWRTPQEERVPLTTDETLAFICNVANPGPDDGYCSLSRRLLNETPARRRGPCST